MQEWYHLYLRFNLKCWIVFQVLLLYDHTLTFDLEVNQFIVWSLTFDSLMSCHCFLGGTHLDVSEIYLVSPKFSESFYMIDLNGGYRNFFFSLIDILARPLYREFSAAQLLLLNCWFPHRRTLHIGAKCQLSRHTSSRAHSYLYRSQGHLFFNTNRRSSECSKV